MTLNATLNRQLKPAPDARNEARVLSRREAFAIANKSEANLATALGSLNPADCALGAVDDRNRRRMHLSCGLRVAAPASRRRGRVAVTDRRMRGVNNEPAPIPR